MRPTGPVQRCSNANTHHLPYGRAITTILGGSHPGSPPPTRVPPALIPTPGPAPTATPSPTATPEGLSVPTDTLGGFPTPTPTPSFIPTPTPTPKPIPTPTIVPISQLPAKLELKWGTLGTKIGQFNSPRGLSIDGQGNVYVLDVNNSFVQKFNTTGEYITRWGGASNIDGTFTNPTALTVDATTNTVYVADAKGRIQSFNSNGIFIASWGHRSNDKVRLGAPLALAAGTASTLWVSDATDGRIQQVAAANQADLALITSQTALVGCNGPGALSDARAIAATPNGDFYVADSGNNRVHWLSSSGESLAVWGSQGTGQSQFNNPQGIAVDSNQNVYVADTGNHRIQVFRNDGTFLGSWGAKGSANSRFDQPMGIDVDPNGKIYVADSGNNRIQVFSALDLTALQPAERVFIPGIQTIDLFIDAAVGTDTAFDIGGSSPLAQSFRPQFSSLSIIDVFLLNQGSGSKNVTLSLRKGGADGPLMLCATQNTGIDQGESAWVSFNIRNIRIEPGALYTIELSPATGANFLWSRTTSDGYTDGDATIDGEKQPFDWKFRTWGFT